jgi:hypothetical protein
MGEIRAVRGRATGNGAQRTSNDASRQAKAASNDRALWVANPVANRAANDVLKAPPNRASARSPDVA